MASADLRKELECSVCLSVYTDPVNINCGHNFCRVCIDRVLRTQKGSGGYFCPQCRKRFLSRPALHKNFTLCNVVENFLSTRPAQEEINIFCTYCIDSPVPAVKSCLLCEASLCERHLRVHSKSPEHVLTDPSTALGNRKCSEHKKILEYYCNDDNTSICVSCCLIGEHKGHQIECLEKASEKKKTEIESILQKLATKKAETESRVKKLQERRRKAQNNSCEATLAVTALIKDLKKQFENLGKQVLAEIPKNLKQHSTSVSELIQQLEIKKDELSRKMRHIEELCNTTDPLTILQELDTKLCETEEEDINEKDKYDQQLHEARDVDVTQILCTFNTLLTVVSGVSLGTYMQEPADITLDIDTAHHNLEISQDRKTATFINRYQSRPATAKTFQAYSQVLSAHSFSSGRHYWEVDVGESRSWRVGMCYPSIDRTGRQARIGDNNKSWCLSRHHNQLSVIHNSNVIDTPIKISRGRIRIYLDYAAGKISFYKLGSVNRCLHTFATTFSEPLHAALGIWENGYIKVSASSERPLVLENVVRKKEIQNTILGATVSGEVYPASRLQTFEQQLRHLTEVFKRLSQFQLKLKLKKFHFLMQEMQYLRHVVSPEGVRPNPEKLAALEVWGVPWTITRHDPNFEIKNIYIHFLLLLPAMASLDLRKELECSVCLSVYTDPVTLKCGHNFCRMCIDRVLETQEAGGYFCPQCRKRFRSQPTMQRNITLCNVVENFLSTHSDWGKIEVLCTYCVDSPALAIKSCLLCEASLCEKHLGVHSKSPEHVLTSPSTALGNRKCPEHKKILEYYCNNDNVCICVSCCLIGEHKGHQIESLEKADEKKKLELKNVWHKLETKRGETEIIIQKLQKRSQKVPEMANAESQRLTALITDFGKQLKVLEKKALSEISRHIKQTSLSISELNQQLEIKKDELSRKMRHIEELCNTTDPLTVLQESETRCCDPDEEYKEDIDKYDKQFHDGNNLDVTGISNTYSRLLGIISDVNLGIHIQEAADILLDVDTANNHLHISDDRKTATWTSTYQSRPETGKRLSHLYQVQSCQSFSSGRHYWEVDVGDSCSWRVGMCHRSRNSNSGSVGLGDYGNSWWLQRAYNGYSVAQANKVFQISGSTSNISFRIYLDYEAGKISFYKLGPLSQHLHTYTATFTQPLYAVLELQQSGCIKILGGKSVA
ncbi:uncharacterized protein PAF06_011432 [Gastrophryne carolinensis]